MGFNRRKMEDERRRDAEKEAAGTRLPRVESRFSVSDPFPEHRVLDDIARADVL